MQQRQVTFQEAVKSGFNKYCCFTGRASRSEYWWWILFSFIVGVIVGAIFGDSTFGRVFSTLVSLCLFLPGLGLSVRRLHDIGKSGWWVLIYFIPVVGVVLFIIWGIKDSDPTPNAYGPVPNLVG